MISSETAPGQIPETDFMMPPEPGAPEPVIEPIGIDAEAQPDPETGLINEDEFFVMFSALVEAPNMGLAFKGVEPFQAFQVSPEDAQARNASAGLYRIIKRVKWLNFILSPESQAAQDYMAIGIFAFGRYQLFKAETNHRQAQAAQDQREPIQAANDPETTPEPPGDEKPPVDDGTTRELEVS